MSFYGRPLGIIPAFLTGDQIVAERSKRAMEEGNPAIADGDRVQELFGTAALVPQLLAPPWIEEVDDGLDDWRQRDERIVMWYALSQGDVQTKTLDIRLGPDLLTNHPFFQDAEIIRAGTSPTGVWDGPAWRNYARGFEATRLGFSQGIVVGSNEYTTAWTEWVPVVPGSPFALVRPQSRFDGEAVPGNVVDWLDCEVKSRDNSVTTFFFRLSHALDQLDGLGQVFDKRAPWASSVPGAAQMRFRLRQTYGGAPNPTTFQRRLIIERAGTWVQSALTFPREATVLRVEYRARMGRLFPVLPPQSIPEDFIEYYRKIVKELLDSTVWIEQASRLLPSYTDQGVVAPTVLTTTDRVDRAFAYTLHASGIEHDQVDWAQLDDVSDLIEAGPGAAFLTFSAVLRDVLTVEEQLQMLGQSSRLYAFRRGGRVGFAGDFDLEHPDGPVILSGYQREGPESVVWTHLIQDPNDGAEVTYFDPELGTELTALWPADAANPHRIEAYGVGSYSQAILRAEFETRLLTRRQGEMRIQVAEAYADLDLLQPVQVVPWYRLGLGGWGRVMSGSTFRVEDPGWVWDPAYVGQDLTIGRTGDTEGQSRPIVSWDEPSRTITISGPNLKQPVFAAQAQRVSPFLVLPDQSIQWRVARLKHDLSARLVELTLFSSDGSEY